jgi:hypothetical protein
MCVEPDSRNDRDIRRPERSELRGAWGLPAQEEGDICVGLGSCNDRDIYDGPIGASYGGSGTGTPGRRPYEAKVFGASLMLASGLARPRRLLAK